VISAGAIWLLVLTLIQFAAVPRCAAQDEAPRPPRDFPPVARPGVIPPIAPGPSTPRDPILPTPESERPPNSSPDVPATPGSASREQVYRIGVGDELSIEVLGEPQLSRVVRVLPDGSIQYPGIGSIYVLGKTTVEATSELMTGLGRILRYPDAQLIVNSFGDQRVFVMGEIEIPGDHAFHKDMTALGAIAQAGGFRNTAQRGQVLVFRRTGPEACEVFPLDMRDAMDAEHPVGDLGLRPFDIVHVPKTFIANLNVFVDQWMRQNISPFTLYLEGWSAFNVNGTRTIVRNE